MQNRDLGNITQRFTGQVLKSILDPSVACSQKIKDEDPSSSQKARDDSSQRYKFAKQLHNFFLLLNETKSYLAPSDSIGRFLHCSCLPEH